MLLNRRKQEGNENESIFLRSLLTLSPLEADLSVLPPMTPTSSGSKGLR